MERTATLYFDKVPPFYSLRSKCTFFSQTKCWYKLLTIRPLILLFIRLKTVFIFLFQPHVRLNRKCYLNLSSGKKQNTVNVIVPHNQCFVLLIVFSFIENRHLPLTNEAHGFIQFLFERTKPRKERTTASVCVIETWYYYMLLCKQKKVV